MTPEEAAPRELGSLLVPERLAEWVWVLAYTALLSTLSVLRYQLWIATGFDLGLYRQGLWLLWHGGLTAPVSLLGQPLLARDGSWVLLLLAPLYHLLGTGFLLVLQAFAFGLGYLLLRRVAQALGAAPAAAHLLGVVYLLYPVVWGANLFDFHPQALGIPLLLGTVLAALRRRPLPFLLLAAACLTVQVAMPLLLLGLGVALLLQRRVAWGLSLLGLAAAGGLADLVLLERLGRGAPLFWSPYGYLGRTPGAGLAFLASHPGLWVRWAAARRSWEYGVWLLLPLAGAALPEGRRLLNPWWIPALGLLEANLIAALPAATDPFNEYSVLAVPFLFTAVLAALGGRPLALGRKTASRFLLLPLLLFAVFWYHQHQVSWHRPPGIRQLAAAVKLVPPAAPVAAQNFVLPHLADRAGLYLPAQAATLPAGGFVLLDPAHTTGTTPPAVLASLARSLGQPGQAAKVYAQGSVTLYRLSRPLPGPP